MLIDCDTCSAPPSACGDCVVTALLARPPLPLHLDDADLAAIDALAVAGLVPPLRLVRPVAAPAWAERATGTA